MGPMDRFRVQPLSSPRMGSPDVRHLLWLACECPDVEIDRLVREVLPRLEVLGVTGNEAAGGDVVVGFAASRLIVAEGDASGIELEYLATREDCQRRGLGRLLVAAVRRRHPQLPLHLTTDDDAVDFYRTLGFDVTAAPRDPRWLATQRYHCRLPPLR